MQKNYIERTYRVNRNEKRFVYFEVKEQTSDLLIAVDKKSYSSELENYVLIRLKKYRQQIMDYSLKHPIFLASLMPIRIEKHAPELIKSMSKAGIKSGTGPMATVAGAIAEFTAKDIEKRFNVKELIIENGGDIYLNIKKTVQVGIFAGQSPFSNKLALEISRYYSPLGVCTSAGTIGHSKSFGKADGVVIASKNTALADSYATAMGNLVKTEKDVEKVINLCKTKTDIISAVIIKGDKIGIWGDFKIFPKN